jgi:hypothetical protein
MDKLFYEDKIIDEVTEGENGLRRVKLSYEYPIKNEDGTEDTGEVIDLPAWELEACTTKEKSDASTARNYRGVFIVDKIYEIMEQYNVRVDEVSFIMQKAKMLDLYKVNDKNEVRFSHWK